MVATQTVAFFLEGGVSEGENTNVGAEERHQFKIMLLLWIDCLARSYIPRPLITELTGTHDPSAYWHTFKRHLVELLIPSKRPFRIPE